MASSASTSSAQAATATGHPADAALSLFARGVVSLLAVWPALRLAIAHGWSKPQHQQHHSADDQQQQEQYAPETPLQRRTRLAEELVDAYYSSYVDKNGALPEPTDIEDFLLDFIEFEFGIALEDGSEISLAKDLQGMWMECVRRSSGQMVVPEGQEGMVERFERMAEKARIEDADPTTAIRATRTGQQDQDDDDESSGTDGDDDDAGGMDVDQREQPGPSASRREKEEPVVDEDGFTMVTKKR